MSALSGYVNGSTTNRCIYRQCLIGVPNWGTYRTRSGTSIRYNIDFTGVIGRFDVSLPIAAASVTTSHGFTDQISIEEFNSHAGSVYPAPFFAANGFISAVTALQTAGTLSSLTYDPGYTGAEVSYGQGSPYYGYFIKVGKAIFDYTSQDIPTIQDPEYVSTVYPLPEVEIDVDTEEELYEKLSQGESIKELAMQKPNKFLVKGENYIMYYGYIKTGFYS